MVALLSAKTRLERVAAVNHLFQDYLEHTGPSDRDNLRSLLYDYICATEGIGWSPVDSDGTSLTPEQARVALAWRESCLCGSYDDEPEDEREVARILHRIAYPDVDLPEARTGVGEES